MRRRGAPERSPPLDAEPVDEARQRRRHGHDQSDDERQPPGRRRIRLADTERTEDAQNRRRGVDADRGVRQRRVGRMGWQTLDQVAEFHDTPFSARDLPVSSGGESPLACPPLCEHVFVEATILHADVDSFFAAVEQRDDPRLRGRPVLVGGGVMLAASYEAKACGVYTPMSVRRARSLCPHAVVVRPRMSAYSEASKALYRVFDDVSPLVEGLSIDEAFLAKVASGVAKPDGLLVVPPQRELAFLHPLPVERLWGVGEKTARRLHLVGITTVGQVARLDEGTLASLLGRAAGRQLHALAHNRDPRRVETRRRRRSMGAQCALGRGPTKLEAVDATLVALVERVTRRMRAAGRVGRTVVLRLRFDDFSRATRSHTLPYSTANTHAILTTARGLLTLAVPMIESRGITLVGVAVSNLGDCRQLALPFDPHSDALDAAVDEVRDRYGAEAVLRAVLLGRRRELVVPLLPD